MGVYTKTGDGGITSLCNGQRILKSDIQFDANGTLDELSSFIGLIISEIKNNNDRDLLTTIQKHIHDMMGVLACSLESHKKIAELEKSTMLFEETIDKLEKKLPLLNHFILPQGTHESCLFHLARTVCRRAERTVVAYFHNGNTLESKESKIIISYLNRLSDLLFMLARQYNADTEVII